MELTRTRFGTYTFNHEGTDIHYPVCDSSGRFAMSPADYGFTVYGTGGNCNAWHRDFTLNGHPVYMLITDNDLGHDVKQGDRIVMGVYDSKTECLIAAWEQEEGALDDTPPINVTGQDHVYLKEMAEQLEAAKVLDDLDKLYLEWVGYSMVLDDPDVTADGLYALLKGYIEECCHAAGVPLSEVFPG